MSDHIRQTIADLQKSLIEDEQKVLDKKRLINQLAQHAGIGAIYSNAELQSGPTVNLAIRSDQFYGQPLASSGCLGQAPRRAGAARQERQVRRAVPALHGGPDGPLKSRLWKGFPLCAGT